MFEKMRELGENIIYTLTGIFAVLIAWGLGIIIVYLCIATLVVGLDDLDEVDIIENGIELYESGIEFCAAGIYYWIPDTFDFPVVIYIIEPQESLFHNFCEICDTTSISSYRDWEHYGEDCSNYKDSFHKLFGGNCDCANPFSKERDGECYHIYDIKFNEIED